MTRVLYSQCWEDPRTLAKALQVSEQDDVLSIGSAGDNSFALLLNKPRSLTLVDRNATQIFLLELKIAALRTLDYDDFVGFLGARTCHDRETLYRHIRPSLSLQARGYWDSRRKEVHRGIIHCGKFEHYLSIFRRAILPLVHGENKVHQLLAVSSLFQQRTFYEEVWNNRRWRWIFRAFFGKTLLGLLGRDPSFFKHVEVPRVGEELLRRIRRGLRDLWVGNNFFIEYILTGQYGDLESTHPYLCESNFQFLKENVGRVRLVGQGLEEFLKSLRPEIFSKFNLSDVFEYMSNDEFERTLQSIVRTCKCNARLAFWTLFVPRIVPPALTDSISPCTAASEELFAEDRTFFYGGFATWNVTSGVRETARASIGRILEERSHGKN